MKKILLCVLCVALGLSLGFAYGQMRLNGLQKIHQAKLKEINQRLSLVQRKYAEERALQSSLEDDKQTTRNELDALKKEKETLASRNRELVSRAESAETRAASLDKKVASLEARATSLDSKNAQLSERLTKAEADRGALDKQQQQTFYTLQQREKEVADFHKRYEQCAEHNASLYSIADDLVRQYEGKGLVKTLLAKEPFTQIKKVEIERLVQDYRDKIDQQKLRSK